MTYRPLSKQRPPHSIFHCQVQFILLLLDANSTRLHFITTLNIQDVHYFYYLSSFFLILTFATNISFETTCLPFLIVTTFCNFCIFWSRDWTAQSTFQSLRFKFYCWFRGMTSTGKEGVLTKAAAYEEWAGRIFFSINSISSPFLLGWNPFGLHWDTRWLKKFHVV